MIKRYLTVNVGSSASSLKLECNKEDDNGVYVELHGRFGGSDASARMVMTPSELHELREGVDAILDAIKANAAGR